MSKNKDFFTHLLTEILQEQSRPNSSHDPGYIYLIKAVCFHGIIPGFYLGRYKIGLSRKPEARVDDFYSNQPPCDMEIVKTIHVKDMKAVETILHKQFHKRRVTLKGRRSSEWFDLNLVQVWQVKWAYSRCERHPKLGTLKPSRIPTSALILALIAGLIAITTLSKQVSVQLEPVTTEQSK
ncbi:GIY-YIG nuclease family protein [Scytonema sp. UIC 10036]|uniref:GIY-YIG nuclease family protein n=1 Tax=Scytonema sp. UIC 10036 TaxID=2304196 RepID=UPI0012DA87B2|nr:GIY-YIG nuclease family protein [Scytonema sp. UIC 10036]MUG92777.1 GIY-YIG nuclease family protein [Scytonema sp. UIC 10036]